MAGNGAFRVKVSDAGRHGNINGKRSLSDSGNEWFSNNFGNPLTYTVTAVDYAGNESEPITFIQVFQKHRLTIVDREGKPFTARSLRTGIHRQLRLVCRRESTVQNYECGLSRGKIYLG